MNVNLDADISNILFLEYMKKKDNENGERRTEPSFGGRAEHE